MKVWLLLLLGMMPACGRSKPAVGDYWDVLHEEVLTFDYETPEFRVSAHRFASSESFLVTVQSKRESSAEHCRSDERFDEMLAHFETLRSVRYIEPDELRKLSKQLSYHRLRIATAPPMEAFERVLSSLPNGHLAVPDEDAAYELSLTASAVEKLRASCRRE